MVSSQHLNTAVHSRFYEFDGMGNRLKQRDGAHQDSGGALTGYTPNGLNQYGSIAFPGLTANPQHDEDGNMVSGVLPAGPGQNSTLVWDGENRLIETQVGSSGPVVNYVYDAYGRRVVKSVGGTNTYWCYDGWNPVAEYSGAVHTSGAVPALTLQRTYVWGMDLSGTLQGAGGVGGLLGVRVHTGGSANTYYPLYDGNGNITEYVNASGAVAVHYEYDPFGNLLVDTSAGAFASVCPHAFSTKPRDTETGLYYYGYRYYDTLTGRWPSKDPIKERGGINLYGMLRNDTIRFVDILGLFGPSGPDAKAPCECGPTAWTPEDEQRAQDERQRQEEERERQRKLATTGGVETPEKPDGTRDSAFHHWGNWGGPGWASGGWRPEGGPLPVPGDSDYKAPIDDRDACYEKHDRAIHNCMNKGCADYDGPVVSIPFSESESDCIRKADKDLADCLREAGHGGMESFAFDTIIPWFIH